MLRSDQIVFTFTLKSSAFSTELMKQTLFIHKVSEFTYTVLAINNDILISISQIDQQFNIFSGNV